MKNYRIAVLDIETDPFLYGNIPKPFCLGYYDGEDYTKFWGNDCIERFVSFMETEPETIIYAHNGGKFDFHFFLHTGVIGNPILVNNGRIMKAKFMHHEIRDSYSAIPVPLASYQKDDIDYRKFRQMVRHKHKKEILAYLKTDCLYLHELILHFIDRFGLKLTVGAVALNILKSKCPFEKITKTTDAMIRPYYHGGRVEPFLSGILEGDWEVFDVNSMYSFVMAEYNHPVGNLFMQAPPTQTTIDSLNKKGKMFFIRFTGYSKKALPIKSNKGLNFPDCDGEFYVTSHELNVGLKYNLIRIDKIIEIIVCPLQNNFKDYVDVFVAEKIAAKEAGNKANEIFAKLLLNSAYGKTGQNPANFYDWHITFYAELSRPFECYDERGEWELFEETTWYEIWRRPNQKEVYHNVGIAASVTGAARAVLLEGIMNAKNVAYCDTDSLICESLDADLHPTRLGAWDSEGTGNLLAIGGKKLYALFDGETCTKKASKGVKFSGEQIKSICEGNEIVWKNPAPSFSISTPTRFVHRKIRKTVA